MSNFIFLPIVTPTDNKNNHKKTCIECGAMLTIEQVYHKFTCSYAIKCSSCNCRIDLDRPNESHIHFKLCFNCGFNFELYLSHKFNCPVIKYCQCMEPVNMDILKCNCPFPDAKCF